MFVAFSHGQEIPVTAGQSQSNSGQFGYYFSDASEAPFDANTLGLLDAVHRDMVETSAGPEGDHSSLPPIFTYLGQFIDHDITGISANPDADPLLPIDDANLAPEQRDDLVLKIFNLRTGRFDLDSLYGTPAPTGNEALDKLIQMFRFPGDRAKMWVGTFGDLDRRVEFPLDPGGDLLRLGRLLESGRFTEADIDALPEEHKRLFVDGDGNLNLSRAIIGDARNDENLFIAQLHLAFLRFHNRVAQEWPVARQAGDEDRVFEWTRGHVRRFYQWLVVNVWLPGVCDPKVVRSILDQGPQLYDAFLAKSNWSPEDRLPMPLEFSTACYRFGHSMVRGNYDWNENFGRGPDPLLPVAGFDLMFLFTGGSISPLGGAPDHKLPGNWGADWDRLVHPMSNFADRSTRLVDTELAAPLTKMVNEGGSTTNQNLIARNLRRGVQHNLPTAQEAIKALNAMGIPVPALTKLQIASGSTAGEIKDGGFDEHTPLWFYTLKEAELLGRGQRLGPMGSHIVAGTIIGLIKRGEGSVLDDLGSNEGRWHPVDGPRVSGQLVDSFAALMRAALVMHNPDV